MVISLFKPQYEFLTNKDHTAFFIGGIGCGKTRTLSNIVLNHAVEYPDSNILLVANTYQQLVSGTIPALTNLLDDLKIKYSKAFSGAKKRIDIYINKKPTTVFLYSLEKYDNIRSIEVGLVAGDEIAYSSLEALNVVMGRLRCKKGALQARFVSSPNGFNFIYDLINQGNAKMINMATRENTTLPKEYLEQLEVLYGGKESPLYKQECEGEFVNLTANSVYFAFDRTKHVKQVKYNPNYPVYCGQDFNIDQMSTTWIQFYDNKFHVFREDLLQDNNANTFSTAALLTSTLPEAKKTVIADGTGKARKTSSTKSDLQILKDAGLTVPHFTNPLIKDRQNSVNRLFLLDRIEIDPNCIHLIKELETLTFKDVEGDKVHLSVALGYVIWHLEPLKKPQAQNTTIKNPFL